MMETTTAQILIARIEENCKRYKDNIAFSILGEDNICRQFTYAELYSKVITFAQKLSASGISQGDRVAIVAENSPQWVVSYLAILHCNCTPVLMDQLLSPLDIIELLASSDVRGLMLSQKTRTHIQSCQDQLSQRLNVPTFNINAEAEPFPNDPQKLPANTCATLDADIDTVAIMYTSGTTSCAKGVMFGNKGVLVTAENNISNNYLSSKDRLLAVIPYHHIYGFMANMICPLLCGASVCMPETVNSDTLGKAFLYFKPTAFCCVPRVFELFANKIRSTLVTKGHLARAIFGSLLKLSIITRKGLGLNLGKVIFRSAHKKFGGCIVGFMSAGAQLDRQTADLFYGLGFSLLNNYGITETNIPISSNTYAHYTLDSCGLAFKGVQIKINEADAQGVGEIMVKTPGMMKGYFRDASASAQAFDAQGWFRTGDLGRFDKELNLFICGRLKDNIVLATGEKATPDDVEKRYRQISGVSMLVVCGVPKGKQFGDEIHAFIVKDSATKRLNSEIEADIRKIGVTLPSFMRISKLHFVDDIPKTSLQKPKRYLLRELALSEQREQQLQFSNAHSKSIPNDSTQEDLNLKIVRDLIAEFGFVTETNDKDLRLYEDLGFDSLSATELCQRLQKWGQIDIASFFKPNITIAEIAALLDNSSQNTATNKQAEADILADFPRKKGLFEFCTVALLRRILALTYRLEISGLENIPLHGGYLICPNHETLFDAFFVLAQLPREQFRRFCCLAADEHLANPFGRFMLRIAGGIPVDRRLNPEPALLRCYQQLSEGAVLLIHPEGTRSLDAKLGSFKKGPAKLSIDSGLPIIPVRIKGGFEIFPKGSFFPKVFDLKNMRRYPLKVSFGKALFPAGYKLEDLNTELRNRVLEL